MLCRVRRGRTPQNTSQIENEFQEELLDAYAEAKTKYNSTRFIRMVYEHSGVETARRLLGTGSDAVLSGLHKHYLSQRLDLSVEAKVLMPRYARLFSSALKGTARRRLVDRDFDVDKW
jgi:hypothetical protein